MKTKSTIAPEKFKIGDRKGNLIEVAFFDDVKEIIKIKMKPALVEQNIKALEAGFHFCNK